MKEIVRKQRKYKKHKSTLFVTKVAMLLLLVLIGISSTLSSKTVEASSKKIIP